MTPHPLPITVEELAAALPTNAQSGLTFDASGRLVVNTIDAPTVWLNGLPLTNSGSLCIVLENAALAAFSTAPTASAYESDLYDD